jgi:hypothetical protein
MPARTRIVFILLASPAATGLPQRCVEPPNLGALTARIDQVAQAQREHRGTSFDQDVVYRVCAIAGAELRPVLRRVAALGDAQGGVRAAAICLARLGDTAALAFLKNELDTTRNATAAAENLIRVGTRRTTGLVIDYMERKQNDPSRMIDLGDAGIDPVFNALTFLTRQVPNGPASSTRYEPLATSIRRWRDWWAADSANGGVLAIEPRVPNDPTAQCLARKAEWGFSQALFDLSIRDTARALTGLFRDLAEQDPRLSTVARTVLVERGDPQEFARLVAALHTSQYKDALYRLQYIGDLRSVGALVGALDDFVLDRVTPEIVALERRRFWSATFVVLSSMVNEPPVAATAPPTQENVDRWREWWAKGQTADALKAKRRVPVE